MAAGSIKVRGYREFLRACDKSSKNVKRALRERLRGAGQIVRDEARRLLSHYDAGSAARLGVSVRARGVSIDQRSRRVTGKRPDYGALQMREALIPARSRKMPEVEREIERSLDEIDF